MLHSFTVLFSLLPQLLFSSHFLLSPAEAYTLPSEYFINCGSKSIVLFGIRNFTQDRNSGPFNGRKSKPVQDTNPSADTPALYQTARIFSRPRSYKLKISQNGTYLVRLHFFAFSSYVSLEDAVFNVSAQPNASAPWLSLLSDFTLKNSNETKVVKEFLLTITAGEFVIYFIPSGVPCLAFVNAIEVFLAPTGFIPENATHINVSEIKGKDGGLLSNVLQKAYRINVGGPNVTEKADTLMRYWISDDQFLLFPGSAENDQTDSDQLQFDVGTNGSTKYIAPPVVYRTAKKLNSNNGRKNITWRFKVDEHARHFVRAHFCDFISISLSSGLNFCINGNFCQWISPYEIVDRQSAPFYADFVLDSVKSGKIDVSVIPDINSSNQTAFLNGLEIMQLMEKSYSSFVPPKEKKQNKVIIASLLGLTFAFIIVAVVVIRLVCMKEDPDKVPRLPSSLAFLGWRSRNDMSTATTASLSNLCLELRIPFAEIRQATQDFDSKLFIGEGGFGKVYSGTLHGKKVAVKRREPGHNQGRAEFQTEIMVLSQTRHRNLVYLIGYCDERSEMILVYEFMEKGNLRDNLYDANGCSKQNGLSWEKRLEICIGSATALHHLHTGSALKIIHRDVKSTNILLDENYTAKVSDFGISKSSHSDVTLGNTGVKGSIGYLDPEYLMSSELTEKSDVYSFGVVLLEVLCARPVIINSPQKEEVNLADWGLLWIKKGLLENIIDPILVDNINPNSLRKFGEIVEKCLQAKGSMRPTMRDLVWDLEYALTLHTGISRENPDESTTNASLQFERPLLFHLPTSSSFIVEENEQSIVGNNGSDTSASEVFSQVKFADAR